MVGMRTLPWLASICIVASVAAAPQARAKIESLDELLEPVRQEHEPDKLPVRLAIGVIATLGGIGAPVQLIREVHVLKRQRMLGSELAANAQANAGDAHVEHSGATAPHSLRAATPGKDRSSRRRMA